MRLSPLSFLVGVGTAVAVPLIARTFRPLAVQATATALDVFEEAQRIIAEQKEAWEDIVAEARVQREASLDAARHPGRSRRRTKSPRPETSVDQPSSGVLQTAAARSASR